MTTLVVLQPGYLPWLGFFDQIKKSDIFIFYDDVQFDKHGWRNRNRIKSANGFFWLSVPVLTKDKPTQLILETHINNKINWNTKHIRAIQQSYSKSPYFNKYFPELESILSQNWINIAGLDIELTNMFCRWLDFDKKFYRSSDLNITGCRSERLLNFCRHFNADKYYSGSAARSYLDVEIFENNNIQVEWQDYQHPVYNQLYGNFIPYLSVIDLIFNEGEKSREIL